MVLEEESRQYLTLNMHQGLYRYCRLTFGVSSAPAIFQRAVLYGLAHAVCYIDDILITGADEKEHLRNLEEVLKQLQYHGIRLKKRSYFLQNSVEYFGHNINAMGLHTTLRKWKW